MQHAIKTGSTRDVPSAPGKRDRLKKGLNCYNEILRDKSGKVIGEIDFETKEAIVEVGRSLQGKTGQLHKLAEVASKRAKRLDVIYGPDTPIQRLRPIKESLRKKWGNRVRFIPHGE